MRLAHRPHWLGSKKTDVLLVKYAGLREISISKIDFRITLNLNPKDFLLFPFILIACLSRIVECGLVQLTSQKLVKLTARGKLNKTT